MSEKIVVMQSAELPVDPRDYLRLPHPTYLTVHIARLNDVAYPVSLFLFPNRRVERHMKAVFRTSLSGPLKRVRLQEQSRHISRTPKQSRNMLITSTGKPRIILGTMTFG